MELFSERLTELMEELEFTPKKLSEITGLSINSIYSWKKDSAYKIYLSNMIKLCDVLECSLDFLAGRTENVLDYKPQKCPPFYDRLREIMKKENITRYRLVKDTKIYDNYFSVWKSGRDPQLYTLIRLADYLDCSIDYLIGRDR